MRRETPPRSSRSRFVSRWRLIALCSGAGALEAALLTHLGVQSGMGLAGIYTHDIAETKVKATKQLAEQHEFPLLVTMEPEPEGKES